MNWWLCILVIPSCSLAGEVVLRVWKIEVDTELLETAAGYVWKRVMIGYVSSEIQI
jgi:hypothetical protein